jgi:putative addiction module component (TIGR02574 family)
LTDAAIQSIISRMSLTSIQEEIVRLSSSERAMLIDILWESLDEQRVKEIEAKWAAESEERIDAVDRGDLQTIQGPSALRDLRSSLRK